MSDKPEGVTLHEVNVSLILTELEGDESQIVWVECNGDPGVMTALGMLRMAEDTVLNWEND